MDKIEFKKRTKAFAVDIARFCKSLPFDKIVRSPASVGANYRAACRAKSKADFVNKLRIVEEVSDESLHFLELICEFYPNRKNEIAKLYNEGNQLLAMVVSSINTALSKAK